MSDNNQLLRDLDHAEMLCAELRQSVRCGDSPESRRNLVIEIVELISSASPVEFLIGDHPSVDDLLKFAGATVAQRQAEYGPPADHFEKVAGFWSLILGAHITPNQVVRCMMAIKLARLNHDHQHVDSWVDLAGYASIGLQVKP